jgi:hypothetical protein
MNQSLHRVLFLTCFSVLAGLVSNAQPINYITETQFATSPPSYTATFSGTATIGQTQAYLTKAPSYSGNNFQDDFKALSLNSTNWIGGVWSGTNTTSFDGEAITLNSAYVGTQAEFPIGSEVTFRAKFEDDDYQNIGFSKTQNPDLEQFVNWVTIGRGGPGFAAGHLAFRDFTGQEIDLGSGLTGAYHIFTLKYVSATTFSVSIDYGTPTSLTFGFDPGISGPGTTSGVDLSFLLSDNVSTGGLNLLVDWVRMNPVYASTGEYDSPIYDTGNPNFLWTNISWSEIVGGGYTVQVAAANLASDLSNPSNFVTVTNGSNFAASYVHGGLFQLKVIFNDGNTAITPVLTNFNINAVGLTPVTFQSLTASASGNDVKLDWSTASESNNVGFHVYRSNDGVKWANIGFVAGAGTTAVGKKYAYTDANLNSGKYYYRLSQEDIDGKTALTNIVTATVGGKAGFSLSQNYPNPAMGNTVVNYSIPSSAHVRISLYDGSGRLVKVVEDAQRKAGSYSVLVDASRMKSGIYYYRIESDGQTLTKKMAIQN